MKRFIIILSLTSTLAFSSFTSLQLETDFFTKQSKLNEAIDFEKLLDSNITFLKRNVVLSKSYYPLSDKYKVGNPIIVQRNQPNVFLPVYAEYFFTADDSIIRYISYDWEKGKYDNWNNKQSIWAEEANKLDLYNDEYNRLKNELIDKLGKPSQHDDKLKKVDSYYSRNAVWETKDFHSELDLVFASKTHRIRWNYYFKK